MFVFKNFFKRLKNFKGLAGKLFNSEWRKLRHTRLTRKKEKVNQ